MCGYACRHIEVLKETPSVKQRTAPTKPTSSLRARRSNLLKLNEHLHQYRTVNLTDCFAELAMTKLTWLRAVR